MASSPPEEERQNSALGSGQRDEGWVVTPLLLWRRGSGRAAGGDIGNTLSGYVGYMFRFHSLLDSGRWEAASWWLLRGGERSEPKRSNHQDAVDLLCSPFLPSLRLRPAVSGT